MNRHLTALALALAMLTAPALAQGPLPTAPQGDQQNKEPPIPQRSVKITAEEGYIIRENVKDTTPANVKAGDVEMGNKAPADVELHDFPPFVLQKVSAVKGFKYFVTSDNQVAVVSSSDRTVADILK